MYIFYFVFSGIVLITAFSDGRDRYRRRVNNKLRLVFVYNEFYKLHVHTRV